jgi:peptide-methionine (S)-S-oxide reductase
MMSRFVSTIAALCVVSAGAAALSRTGPAPTVAVPAPVVGAMAAPTAAVDTAVFAGGCFWGIEAVFEHVKGVVSATSGYTGGTTAKPSYEDVSTGDTGHAESVRVVFDPAQVTYAQLLQVFFSSHDPTQLNHQDPDHGTQYRSAVFYRTPEQRKVAEAYVKQLAATKTFKDPVVTQVAALKTFYDAEGYHQNYLAQHPDQAYIRMYDAPKLVALKQHFPTLYR